MQKYLEILESCPLFEGAAQEELTAMLRCMEAKAAVYPKESFIFLEGEQARHVGIVISGEVRIMREDYSGSRSVITSVGAGEVFGEVFACAEVEKLPVSAMAAAESCVLLLPCKRLITACGSSCPFHGRVIQNLLRIVSAKNLQLNQKLELLSKKTTREKLMAFLHSEARRMGSNSFTIPYDRQALADYLGVERSAMSAELSRLRRDGRIDFHRSSFRIL